MESGGAVHVIVVPPFCKVEDVKSEEPMLLDMVEFGCLPWSTHVVVLVEPVIWCCGGHLVSSSWHLAVVQQLYIGAKAMIATPNGSLANANL